ncbi:hypothetical protein HK096_010722, partial [Nowakowskiella sp. JEL0078]
MPVIELREQMAKKEKEHDRFLLKLSMGADAEYMKNAKEFDHTKLKIAIATAQYNHTKAIEKEAQRKKEIRNLPMGDLYENRIPPPDRVLQNKLLAEGVREQINEKYRGKIKDRLQKEYEDRILRAADIEEHIDKLKRRQQQQEALREQIRTQIVNKEPPTEPMKENSFARSENLMFLYKKEKAKQLYQEQLAIVSQKKDYETKISEIERRHSLERLAISRK